MIASLSAKDDHLEELQEQLKSQTEEHAQLETMLAAIKRERDTSLESIVTLKHEVSVIRAELEQRDKDIQSLMAGKEVANNQFEELQAKVSKRCTPSTTQHTLTQSAINYSCMKR
jgi:chromosome segregation ATPase